MIGRLEAYKIFNQVAIEGSFSKAAKSLFMSQPAISQSIAQLEGDLDVRLFTRTQRGVVLTEEGNLLFQHVNPGINLIANGEKRVSDAKNLLEGQLKLGVGDTVSRYFLMDCLEVFNRRFPAIKMKIINKTTMELGRLIKSGDIDLAIVNLPLDDTAFSIVPVQEVHDVFIAGERFSNLSGKILRLSELSALPLIMLDSSSRSRQYVEGFLKSRGVYVTPDIELGSHDLLLQFARIGLGISCVVKEYSKEFLDGSSIFELELEEAIPVRSIGACRLKGVEPSPAAEKFMELVLSVAKI
jgi:DNA-binding transcriptional LysR family regulator